MITLNPIEYIVGIDLGTTASGVSIAHVNDPSNIITVSSWDDSKRISQKFHSSILYLKNENDSPLCGIKPVSVGGTGVYIDKISQYLVDIDASNEKLGELMDGLTVKKVMIDYLKYFIQIALKRLQVHDKLVKNEHFQEFVNEEFIDEDIKTVCYCLVCPTDRQEFMKDCFIEAGIIEESEAERRLSFAIKAVAIAHYQLSLDRNTTGIQQDQDYFVVDLGDISIGIAKIHAASTESLSTITNVCDNILNINHSLIDQFVQTFSENAKYGFHTDIKTETAISQEDIDGNPINFTYEDLNRIVLEPFIESLAEFVSEIDETYRQCKMFFSGSYGVNGNFIKNLIIRNRGKLKYHHSIVKDSIERVSSGAVSSRLSTYKSQTPFSSLYNKHTFQFSDRRLSLRETLLCNSGDRNNENDAYDFIVGIDFGTTFSGCSYVQLRDKNGKPVDKKKFKTKKVDWPGGNTKHFGKSPTLLMYDKRMKPIYWGEEARIQAKRHKDRNLLEHFKLFLCPESLEEPKGQGGFVGDGNPENEVCAVRIIADYLQVFQKHVFEYIVAKETNDNVYHYNEARLKVKYKIRYVITVPAMWNSLARNTMAQAAIKATMIKKNDVNQLLIISEPEAAALFYMKRMIEYFEKRDEEPNDAHFIVCDAGGGTVDLATFNLQLNKKDGDTPTTDPMICQIGDGIGDICGSTCLDLRFRNYLLEFYKSFGVDMNKENVPLDDIMKDFVENYKLRFMPNLRGGSYYCINLPAKGIRNFTGDSTYRMTNGNRTLKMKNQDMKEKIFDPVIDRIFYLIDDQLNQAKKLDRRIDAILMIGGFSQSLYLQQRIKDRYKGVCHVNFPIESVGAISYGAVYYALNPRKISKQTATQSLGLEVQAPFDRNLTDSKYFVKRGESLKGKEQTVYQKDVYVSYPNAAVIAIFACNSKEDANKRYVTESHVKIMEAKIIMPSIGGIDGRVIHFTISLQITRIGVTVTTECQDQLINAEVLKITNNQRSSVKIIIKCSSSIEECTKASSLSSSLSSFPSSLTPLYPRDARVRRTFPMTIEQPSLKKKLRK
ncbi:uncharacterized protein EV154DRAFT_599767 [Mucor mucedo]|uniref:uncharacterized protein n=1 Tax=Mucor mucedo TaxID=29922 RepID=UPI00221FFF13|nr:uncharacterized protein EV154DRAFT_599767 [Mucor mucedo]KAI7894669.1 hypothetical protein EV154DRAFT_599767 [Mucor mucedo]